VVNTDLLTGLLKDVGGVAMTMILDFGMLIESEFSDIAKASATISATHALSEQNNTEEKEIDGFSDELQLVSFSVADQEYAISISDVQEIVQVPEQIIHVPHSDSHVLGVMTLRQRMLPLVSLRRMFGLPRQEADEHSRIVVISVGNAAVGVVMDTVNEVLRVSKNDVSAMPSMLARDGALSDINEICRLNNGKRLVSIISAENMFHHHAVQEALSSIEMTQDDEQMVVFRLGSEEFGVPIESVQEIVRVPEELTHVPKAPAFIEGVINLRGAVLPVVDQRRRLGLPTLERCEQQRIMVFLFDGVRTGFIVDSVAEVLKVPRSAIEPAPHLSVDQVHLISRVANLEKQKRLILLMDPSHLLESKDVKGLSLLTG
jgi:purine-binding chemotaxis protein CheW